MIEGFARGWSSRLLFWASVGIAALLVVMVLLAPLCAAGGLETHGWRRMVVLFARDVAVRRTAIASALGLAATGWVFFWRPRSRPRGPSGPRTPPVNVVGA
jgi:hypothetical protein